NTDRLLIFIDNGKVRCTAAASLSFEYSYDLQVILTDFAGHPDSVMVPLLAWLRVNQSELLENLDKSAEGIKFEADLLDKSKVDMSLSLPLTERVVVRTEDMGTVTISHPGEPQRNLNLADGLGEWIVPNG
ncbi:phage tail protein, partial [Pseudomonas sp. B6(2017)]